MTKGSFVALLVAAIVASKTGFGIALVKETGASYDIVYFLDSLSVPAVARGSENPYHEPLGSGEGSPP